MSSCREVSISQSPQQPIKLLIECMQLILQLPVISMIGFKGYSAHKKVKVLRWKSNLRCPIADLCLLKQLLNIQLNGQHTK